MAVDLEAIARRGQCDVSNLKLALPLLDQGYQPPFLAKYRRDELGGLDEATLWALKAAHDAEQRLTQFREELLSTWQETPLQDSAIGDAIRKSGSSRTLQRLAKRLRQESSSGADTPANRLAVRLLNPQKGDASDPAEVAAAVEQISETEEAVQGLPESLAKRLTGDPRVVSAVVRWLGRNAKIHVSNVHDPHVSGENESQDPEPKPAEAAAAEPQAAEAVPSESETAPAEASAAEASTAETVSEPSTDPHAAATDVVAEGEAPNVTTEATSEVAASGEGEAAEAEQASAEAPAAETASAEEPASETTATEAPAAEASATSGDAAADLPGFTPDENASTENSAAEAKPAKPAAKKQKKISPRQRRRRWLVSVLKPLEGKRLQPSKFSAFQIVMLGRALRSQVAVCAFQYDAAKLVAEIREVVKGFNPALADQLDEVVMRHEADIREAAESAWWDELHEKASSRLVGIVANHLRGEVNRGAIEAKVVMSIDAVGPKTAATAIVSADGRVLHGEDVPCQLSGAVRGQAVAKMGELIHQFNVDLVVISNGPARRACLIALGDLIAQSPDNSIRWTLADRSGADAYSSSEVAGSEMRSTPRRFRAAAWIAFSILYPAQAYAKVDPLRLRLASFQSELSDDALAEQLGTVLSGASSQGGVDVNAAPAAWLQQMPGVAEAVAQELVAKRQDSLIGSRAQLEALSSWPSPVDSRQAVPFLRVYNSDEVLDGTLIHPDDYALAKKLANALELELPPACPPGYIAPTYEAPQPEVKLVDATQPAEPAAVEDFDTAGAKAGEFQLDEAEQSEASAENSAEADAAEQSTEQATAEASDADSKAADASTAADAESAEPASEAADAAAETATEETPAAEAADASEETAASDSAPPADQPAAAERVVRPRPPQEKIDKCVKEWQIGRHRTNQVINWLCDPFAESTSDGNVPAVLKTMPTLKTLRPGDEVIGVVVGVMNFGVFVELAPDCSGLIHVSRLSDGYVEDLNEAVQVGDVVTAWVTGIDEKRRRVGLSALSPEQEEKLKERRQQEAGSRGGRGNARGGQGRGGQRQGGKPGGARQGGQGRSGGGQARSGAGGGDRKGGRGGEGRGGDRNRSGQRRDGRQRGGNRKERRPESYRVVAKPEAKPITDAMQKGDEPLRSFGDLMQFYSGKDEPEAKQGGKKSGKKKDQSPKSDNQPAPDAAAETTVADQQAVAEQPATPPAPPAAEVTPAETPQVPSPNPEPTSDDAAAKSEDS